MIKKLLWMTIAVLVAAVGFYTINGVGFAQSPTEVTPTQNENNVNAIATQQSNPLGDWINLEPTLQYTSTPTTKPSATPSTPTATAVLPTATSISTSITPIVTNTPIPTFTATTAPTQTATSIPTTVFTATPTSAATPVLSIQTGSPKYMANFAHTDWGCSWEGIAGQIFDASGNPLPNYIIKVAGTYNGKTINLVGLTGMTAGSDYGPEAYELRIDTASVKTTGQLTIQVYNPSGVSVIDPIKFDTYASCSQNLIIMNFTQQ